MSFNEVEDDLLDELMLDEFGLEPVLMGTRAVADAVATILISHPLIQEVLLFGSAARNQAGHDLDLILITDDEHYEQFIAEFDMAVQLTKSFFGASKLTGQAYHAKLARLGAAVGTFDDLDSEEDRFDLMLDQAQRVALGAPLDIFVFPLDWRDRLDELQHALPHGDPNFMSNIAKDAVKIA